MRAFSSTIPNRFKGTHQVNELVILLNKEAWFSLLLLSLVVEKWRFSELRQSSKRFVTKMSAMAHPQTGCLHDSHIVTQ